jgi:hypothetical protein
MRTAAQLAYPSVVLLIDRAADRRYQAVAISAEEGCNPESIGACCWLGDLARPRYIVDGIERGDFDPTIPDDLARSGWYWHGGWLAWQPTTPDRTGLVVGMPKASLDDIWTAARKLDQARAQGAAARAQDAQRKAKPARKAKAQPPATPAPAVVVVVEKQPAAIEQLALF